MLPAWKRAREYVTYEAKSVPRYHPCSTQRPSTHGRLITGQRAPQGCKRPSVLAAPLQSQIEKRRREAARKPSVAAASREYTLYRAPKHTKVAMTRRSGCARRSAAARVHVTWQECRPVACADGRPGRREGRVRPPTGERDEMADGPGASVCGACGAPESHPVLGHRARIRSRYGTAPPSE